MPTFNEDQKRISLLLLHKPKTIEELNKQLNIPHSQLNNELKEMLKVGVLEKEGGFPTKYKLKSSITEAVLKRKEIEAGDENRLLRLRAIIEASAIEQELLEKSLKKIEAALKKEENFTVYDCILQKTIKEGEHFHSYLEVNLSVKNFQALMRLMLFFGPTSVEIIKPEKYELSIQEMQDGLMDLAEMVHAYNDYLLKQMNKRDLEEFHNKLFSK